VAAAGRTCDRAPGTMRAVCYQSLGRDITSYAKNDPDETIRLCRLGSPRYRGDCYIGAVKVFVDLKATIGPGFDFCRRLEDSTKARCYEALGEEIGALANSAPERAALCEGSEPGYVDACRYGARLSERRPPGLVAVL
jgi:hypothetical protein